MWQVYYSPWWMMMNQLSDLVNYFVRIKLSVLLRGPSFQYLILLRFHSTEIDSQAASFANINSRQVD